ncbi:MAG TPA: group 1 truncated hemoglobin [Actinomycetes bacterium]|nr:group 1 truncated hemoglobin [Actinomycetes bacterium]
MIDLDRIEALARAAGLPVEEFLQAATAAHARRQTAPRPATELYQRIRYAGGLRRLVDSFYPRVLADPLLMGYFKHLNDRELQWLRWHMLTLLVTVTGGPTRYEGRDLHEAHADLHITGEAFDRVAWHLQQALQDLEVHPSDQQAILAQVNARRGEVVTFEDPF